jgi:nicotinate-nucleotide adenylyltransferase
MPSRTSSWIDRVLIFGGTFDPPHLGHREAILQLIREFHPRRVIIVPAGQPPLKTAGASAEDRLAMARLGLDFSAAERGATQVTIDDREIRQAEASGKPSYTAGTLDQLGSELTAQGLEPVFVMGGDQLAQMHRWNRFPEVLGLASWLIVLRKPMTLEQAMVPLREWQDRGWFKDRGLWVRSTEAREMSSTRVRAEFWSPEGPISNELEPRVARYAREHGLYRKLD